MTSRTAVAIAALLLAGCSGRFGISNTAGEGADEEKIVVDTISEEDPDTYDGVSGEAYVPEVPVVEIDEDAPGIEAVDSLGESGMRRLTRAEVVDSVEISVGVSVDHLVDELPLDIGGTTHFDNEVASQSISSIEVSEYLSFAEEVGARAAADVALPARVAGCTPLGADDIDCLTAVTEAIATRLFRRTVDEAEAARFSEALIPYAIEDGEFATGVELVVTALLIHPEFLYRTEPDVDVLDGPAIASRMSFLIWGTGPDEELLAAAEAGFLTTESERRVQAERMLEDPRARTQWRRFHAMWLGYAENTLPAALADDMEEETGALIESVVFDDPTDWMELFRRDRTFVSPELADFYGLPAPANVDWVDTGSRRGGGVLSHATVLNHGHKGGAFSDTSPTLRGYELFKRLTCGTLGGIPPQVDVDSPPGSPGQCKADAYSMRDNPNCSSCHQITDGIGFGLENFGFYGEWRDVEPNNDACVIDGVGSFRSESFVGPAELGEILAADPAVRTCATRQLFRFATGRLETAADEERIEALATTQLRETTLTDTLVELIASPAFITRGEDR